MKNYWLDKIQSGKIGMQTDFHGKLLCDLNADDEKQLLKHLLEKYKDDEEVLNAISFLQTTLEKKTVKGQVLPYPPDAAHHHIPNKNGIKLESTCTGILDFNIKIDPASIPSTITIASSNLGNYGSSVSSYSSSYSGSPPFNCYTCSSSSSSSSSSRTSSVSSSSASSKYIIGGDAAIAADLVVEAKGGYPQDDEHSVQLGCCGPASNCNCTADLDTYYAYQYVQNEELQFICNEIMDNKFVSKFQITRLPLLENSFEATVRLGEENIHKIFEKDGKMVIAYNSPWNRDNLESWVMDCELNKDIGWLTLYWNRPPTSLVGKRLRPSIKVTASYEYEYKPSYEMK